MGSAISVLLCCVPRKGTLLPSTPLPEPLAPSDPKPIPIPVQRDHPFLFNSALLAKLFLVFDPTDPAERATCISSALVCRAWSDHASKVFWEGPVDFLALYGVLLQQPRSRGWRHDADQMSEYLMKIQLDRPYHNPFLWKRLLICSARILRLDSHWGGAAPSPIEVDLLRSLLLRNDGRTLFPSLQSITWHESPGVKGLVQSLVGSSLQRVQLFVQTANRDLEELMTQLASASPSIYDLTVNVTHRDPQPFTVQCLRPHSHLRSLVLAKPDNIPVAPDGLRAILLHLQLESLSLGIAHFGSSSDPLQGCQSDTLRSLECDGMPADLTALLSCFPLPSLGTLALRSNASTAYEPDVQRALALALRSNPLANTLHSLTWSYANALHSHSDTAAGPPVAVYADMLETLSGYLPRLETLSIQIQHSVDLRNEDISMFAPQWPGLKKLELPLRHYLMPDADRIRARSTLPSVAALVPLARHCAALEYLAMELSDDWAISGLYPSDPAAPTVFPSHGQLEGGGQEDEDDAIPTGDAVLSPQQRPLERLYLTLNQPVADVQAFARVVDSLFPNLDVDRCDARYLHEEVGYKRVQGMWETVGRLQRERAGEVDVWDEESLVGI